MISTRSPNVFIYKWLVFLVRISYGALIKPHLVSEMVVNQGLQAYSSRTEQTYSLWLCILFSRYINVLRQRILVKAYGFAIKHPCYSTFPPMLIRSTYLIFSPSISQVIQNLKLCSISVKGLHFGGSFGCDIFGSWRISG